METLALTKKYQKYPKFKDSGVDWVGNIPQTWDRLPLKALFRRMKKTRNDNEKLLSVYRDYGVIEKSSRDDNFNKESEDLSSYQLVSPGDLVTNKMKTWQGSIAISKLRGIVSPAYYVMAPLTRQNPAYFHYLLRSDRYVAHYENISKGIRVNQWDLDYLQFKNSSVLIPSPTDQEKIAKYLDQKTAAIDAIIEKKQKQIALLKEKRVAVINQAVTKGLDPEAKLVESGVEWIGKIPEGWKIQVFKTIAKISASNVDKIVNENDPKVLLCNYTNAYNNEYVTKELDYMASTASATQISRFELKAGDILLTKDSETADDIGVPAYVPGSLQNVICGYHLYLARCFSNKVSPEYIFRFLQTKFARTWFENRANGVTRFGIGAMVPKNIPILIPPLAEQKLIVKEVASKAKIIDSSVNKILQTIELLKELKSSLISYAVTGKIRV